MKTIIVALLFLFAGLGSATAQKKPVDKTTKTTKVAEKKEDKSKSTGMKKDGTPDMRLKENKDAKKPIKGPLKKDGSADMRFKTNKTPEKKK